jgi:predicted polyphosphate/ATP-dependent NAD kinase
MPRFNELFIFKAEGDSSAQRETREGELARTTFVPAADAKSAAAAAAELKAGGLDLIELFGGFGAQSAAAVLAETGGEVPVGLTEVAERPGVGDRAVIFASSGADSDPATDRYVHEHAGGRMTIVAMPDTDASPAAARALVDEGIERIEVCGGHGPVPAAAVSKVVGDRVPVGAVLFGFESMAGVAAYQERFAQAMTQ